MAHESGLRFSAEETQPAAPLLRRKKRQPKLTAEKADAAAAGAPDAPAPAARQRPAQGKASAAAQPAKLLFEENRPRQPAKLTPEIAKAPLRAAETVMRGKLDDASGGNVGAESANAAVTASETGSDVLQYGMNSRALHRQRRSLTAERRLDKANIETLYDLALQKTPQGGSNPLSRWQQKQRIKRQYTAAKRAAIQTGQPVQVAGTTLQAAVRPAPTPARRGMDFIARHKGGAAAVAAVFLVAAVVMNLFSAGTVLVQGAVAGMAGATYPSADSDMLAAEAAYTELEQDLQTELDEYAARHPGHDEYRIEQDEISHDPHVLAALLTAYRQGEWTYAEISPLLQQWFDRQYTLTETVTVEQRTRPVPTTAPDGTATTVDETYDHSICTVTLTNFGLARLAPYLLGEDALAMYATYLASYGNRPDLFTGAVLRPDPQLYDVPADALSDERFAAMLTEAEKYIGYPYVWGGSTPATSFDCSGFICWVIDHSIGNVGRTTAQGLYDLCTPISAGSAMPGDLVFFTGTYASAGPVSHVGLYVGNGIMLHCGDPISYTNLGAAYWQQHLYAYGRLP